MSVRSRRAGPETGRPRTVLPLAEALRQAYAVVARAQAASEQQSIATYAQESLARALRLVGGRRRLLARAPHHAAALGGGEGGDLPPLPNPDDAAPQEIPVENTTERMDSPPPFALVPEGDAAWQEAARRYETDAETLALAIDNARLHDEAQRAIRLRDEFLSIASHELRTPITLVQLEVQGLLRGARRGTLRALSDEQVVARLESAEGGVKRLTRMVSELLDVSHMAENPLMLTREEVDLAIVAAEVVARFEETATRSTGTLSLDATPGASGRWDRMRVEQLVTNLVSNAVKYGAGKPVSVRVEASAEEAVLAVQDHGIGIAPEDVPRIFGRFERAVSERNYGGLGLGLYLARQIVDAHGGTIAVESAPGAGATFTVRLPRRAPVTVRR